MSASKFWTEAMIELPGVREGGMLGRNGQRKLGTTRGSPRRSRTAKASPISRSAVKSRCAREWDGWGRLSGDGPRQQNSNQSEDPLGRRATHPPWRCTIESSARHSAGLPKMTAKCTNGGCKPNMSQCTPGAGLSWLMRGKAPPEMPAFQPYRGKPAVRNDRESRGNDGIIRSPGSRLDSTRLRDEDGQPPHLLGRRRFLHLAAGAAALPAVSSIAWAQAYPTRTVRFILPFGAGSASDTTARLFAERLSARWGKPVVVENRPGGDGLVSLDAFVGAHEDHTMWFGPAGTFNVLPYQHD